VTAIFLHGNLLHILFNSYALYYLGRITEFVFAPGRFLLIYFASGVMGNVLTHFLYPNVFSIGASGSVFGLVGILFAIGLRKDHPRYLTSVTGTALLPMIVINLVFGFTVPGINNAAHLGGLATGFLLGMLLKPYPLRSIQQIRFWKIVQWVIIGIVVFCLGLALFTARPPVQVVMQFHQSYAAMLERFRSASEPDQFRYYISMLQPYDSRTENLTQQARAFLDSQYRDPNLNQLWMLFNQWELEILEQYKGLLQMREQ